LANFLANIDQIGMDPGFGDVLEWYQSDLIERKGSVKAEQERNDKTSFLFSRF